MVQIQNSDAINAIRNGAKLSISESFPQDLGKTVVPVMDMTPNNHRVVNISARGQNLNSASATIYTTPTDKDFYLTSCVFSLSCNATSTGVTSTVNATINGAVVPIMEIGKVASVAMNPVIASQSWDYKSIKIDRGTNITITHNDSTATIRASVVIQGYTVEAQT